MKKIQIFTDGSSRGNPGPGGYGTILTFKRNEKELSQGFMLTTNNRMELMGVIAGLETLTQEGLDVEIISDSKYVVDAVNKKWVFGWEKKGFREKKNADLWQRFLKSYRKHHVTLTWIKGHAGHVMNERCDKLAVKASKSSHLLEDTGYLINTTS